VCGIAGGWLPEPLGDEVVAQALGAMRHRGPDDRGSVRRDDVLLAMCRLSIIDLESGQQPIANEDGTVVVVSNGEIYNYRELTERLAARGHTFRTKSDTEVLVHLYEEHGPELCRELRGMFAFALYDARSRRLLLGRDRFGKKPLYVVRTPEGGLVFASELKALRPLAAAAGRTFELDPQAIYDYLSIGSVPQPSTVWRGVRALGHGSWLTFDGVEERERSYWTIDYRRIRRPSYAEALDGLRQRIAESTTLRLRSDVPLGVFLSGGVDSSVVAYEASRQIGPSLRTFTVAMDVDRFDESGVAARTARAFGVRHDVLPLEIAPLAGLEDVVRRYDQPFWDSSAIPSLAISRLARQYVTVVLTGDGGDEMFAGYRHHVAAWLADRLRWVPRPIAATAAAALRTVRRRRHSAIGFLGRFAGALADEPGRRHLAWTSDLLFEDAKRELWLGPPVRSTEEWLASLMPSGVSSLRRQIHADVAVNLLSDMLVKIDIATMAASLEARSPLLDHTVSDFVSELPDDHLMRRGRRKSLLRDAYRGRVPDEVLDGTKLGFRVPLESWLDRDLRQPVHDTLASRGALVREWIRGDWIDRLLAERGAVRDNWPEITYALLILELWLRENRVTPRATA
jgi:asparagine synthase (glutamine-hydrolysing)